jgi:hypothetical protein
MWFAFLAQEITAQPETHLWTCVFRVLRSPCHVGGGRGAGMHSITRVSRFLGMQSQDNLHNRPKALQHDWWWALPAHLAALRCIEAQQARVNRTHAQNMDKIEFLYVSCAATEIC